MNREIGLIFIGIEEVDDTWATGSGGQRRSAAEITAAIVITS